MGFIIVVFFAVVVIVAMSQGTKRNREKWRSAASALGLSYAEGGFGGMGTISGSRNGHKVVVSTFTKGSGNSAEHYTKYHIDLRDRIPFDLRLSKQGMIYAVKQMFGFEDVQIGDRLFDDQVLVRAAFPDRARAFLDQETRDRIRALLIRYPSLVVTNTYVKIEKRGVDSDTGVITHCVRNLESFCDELIARASAMNDPAEKPAPAPAPASRENPYIIEPEVVVMESDFMEDAEMIPLSEDDKPPAVFEPEAPPMVEPEVGSMVELEPVPEPEPELEVSVELEPEPETPAVVSDLRAITEELYGAGSSLAANALFAERFENLAVTGSGELKRVSKFSYDPVFKEMKGAKATVLIGEIAGPYSKIKVKAEIAFPAERFDELKAREGEALSISGRLVGQDAMMNQLHVVAD